MIFRYILNCQEKKIDRAECQKELLDYMLYVLLKPHTKYTMQTYTSALCKTLTSTLYLMSECNNLEKTWNPNISKPRWTAVSSPVLL